MRQIKKCLNCRDEREIVAHGLCAKCYMGHRREQGRRQEQVTLAEDAAEAANSATGGKSVAAAAGATAGAATQQIPLHTTTDDLKKVFSGSHQKLDGTQAKGRTGNVPAKK